jgi:hypothetical protein
MRCTVLCALVALGCGDPALTNPDLSVTEDMRTPQDLSVAFVTLGGACNADVQCADGKTPVCFRKTLFNSPNKLATPQGYCSSKCDDDNDCGGDGLCRDYGTSGKWCFRYCERASECRSLLQGYACLYGNYCFPNGNLNCDPTVAGGRCGSAPQLNPGGCVRVAYGKGETGYCYDGCQVGVGNCGDQSQCLVYDLRGMRDPESAPTEDTFIGPICVGLANTPNAIGTVCKSSGSNQVSLANCVEGAECYTKSFFGGDDLCKQLCTGAVDVDGGTPPCPGGTTCTDVWQLLGTAYPAGLCL